MELKDEERLLLDRAAKESRSRGLADYIRSTALKAAGGEPTPRPTGQPLAIYNRTKRHEAE